MTPQERKVIELALQALEGMQNAIYNITGEHVIDLNYAVEKADVAEQTITTIKKALAKPDQEPVAWTRKLFSPELGEFFDYKDGAFARETDSEGWTPLYTNPPQRTWVGLTDNEIEALWTSLHDDFANPPSATVYERAIEAKLKQKNGYAEEKNT